MNRNYLALPLLAFALTAFGCTPTPEQTCDKLAQLSDQDPYKDVARASTSFARGKCLKLMEEMKERDANAYKCTADMVKSATTINNVFLEIAVCDKNRPKEKKVAAKNTGYKTGVTSCDELLAKMETCNNMLEEKDGSLHASNKENIKTMAEAMKEIAASSAMAKEGEDTNCKALLKSHKKSKIDDAVCPGVYD